MMMMMMMMMITIASLNTLHVSPQSYTCIIHRVRTQSVTGHTVSPTPVFSLGAVSAANELSTASSNVTFQPEAASFRA